VKTTDGTLVPQSSLLQPDKIKIIIHENFFLLTDKAQHVLTLYSTARALCVYDSAAESSEKLIDPTLKNNFLLLFLLLDGLGPLACSHPDLFCKQLRGRLGWGISPSVGHYLHRTTPTQKIADMHPCLY
jgi:hypothetical protein